ncbi:MAG: TSUP family transporter [Brevibacterium sp.]|nr:TSUP family transporter [Brevibacterium sp.]
MEALTAGIDVTLGMLLWLLAAGALAGWIDAVVGGGGLIQLPALLLVPGMTPVQAVATNKVGSIAGTTASAMTYLRKVTPDRSATIPAAATAFLGAVLGAKLATPGPSEPSPPLILAARRGGGLFTAPHPSLGAAASLRFGETSKRHHGLSWLIGFAIGIYDGVLGPGTGSFLVIAFVSVIGFSFLQASVTAKIINWATNFGALVYFIPDGQVVWALGLVVAVGNVLGGTFGARTALKKGSGFVRVVFVVVVSAMILKLGYDVISGLIH